MTASFLAEVWGTRYSNSLLYYSSSRYPSCDCLGWNFWCYLVHQLVYHQNYFLLNCRHAQLDLLVLHRFEMRFENFLKIFFKGYQNDGQVLQLSQPVFLCYSWQIFLCEKNIYVPGIQRILFGQLLQEKKSSRLEQMGSGIERLRSLISSLAICDE